MRKIISSLAALFIGTALHAFPTNLTTGDLTAHADVIVIGKCTGGRSRWEDRNLFTFMNIAVQEVLKGEPRKSLTVVLPGGVDLDGPAPIGQDFEGAPVIAPGEEVFLFLRAIEELPGTFAIVGFSQGKFSIRRDKASKIAVREPNVILSLSGRQGTAAVSVPLPKLRQEVRQLLAVKSAKPPAGRKPQR